MNTYQFVIALMTIVMAAIPPTIAAVMTHRRIGVLEVNTNSKMDEAIHIAVVAAEARGVLAERLRQEQAQAKVESILAKQ
jgi:hypothetical protein